MTENQEQQMLKSCPHYGPSPARDAWIAGYEAALKTVPVQVIPLNDGKQLRHAEIYQAGPIAWQLFTEDGSFVRVLNEYEAGFINDALSAAQSPTQSPVDPLRKYVEDFASKGGWTKDSGEGAFDFVQRISYAQGVEDGRNRPPQTPPEQNQKPIRVFGWVWKDKRHEDGCSYVPSYTPAQHVQNGELFALVDPVDLHEPLANTSWNHPN